MGAGYVGLVSGTCFAELGFDVVCVDRDADKVEQLRAGTIPIFEPGLEDLVAANVSAGRLHFTTSLRTAVATADVVFLAVGTPSRASDGRADLSYVFAAAEDIAQAMSGYTVVVTKSTVPVGTGRQIETLIRHLSPGADFDVVSNPEFLREGSAISDFMRPDRIVFGTRSPRAHRVMRRLYAPLEATGVRILSTTVETSELTKYAANGFLATKISFINEIADLCEAVGANVTDLADGIGLDPRIGRAFLNAGPGYGGSCFPKDCTALVGTARDALKPLKIVEAVIDVNETRKRQMAQRIIAQCGSAIEGKRIAILGLTFKPNTDDMRDAPSLVIARALTAAGARVMAYDPKGMPAAAALMEHVQYCADAYHAAQNADAVVLLTEWDEFQTLDLERLRRAMRGDVFVDLRNVYDPARMANLGFNYSSIGRGEHAPTLAVQAAA